MAAPCSEDILGGRFFTGQQDLAVQSGTEEGSSIVCAHLGNCIIRLYIHNILIHIFINVYIYICTVYTQCRVWWYRPTPRCCTSCSDLTHHHVLPTAYGCHDQLGTQHNFRNESTSTRCSGCTRVPLPQGAPVDYWRPSSSHAPAVNGYQTLLDPPRSCFDLFVLFVCCIWHLLILPYLTAFYCILLYFFLREVLCSGACAEGTK